MKYNKFDAHAHVWRSKDVDLRIDDADRLGIDFLSISNPTIHEDMVEVARRFPEAMFQMDHISSGDFEYICKCIKNYRNIYVDVPGSHNAEKQVDFAIEHLGVGRVFFGTENSVYQGIGNILSSNKTDAQRMKLFFDNYNSVLRILFLILPANLMDSV